MENSENANKQDAVNADTAVADIRAAAAAETISHYRHQENLQR